MFWVEETYGTHLASLLLMTPGKIAASLRHSDGRVEIYGTGGAILESGYHTDAMDSDAILDRIQDKVEELWSAAGWYTEGALTPGQIFEAGRQSGKSVSLAINCTSTDHSWTFTIDHCLLGHRKSLTDIATAAFNYFYPQSAGSGRWEPKDSSYLAYRLDTGPAIAYVMRLNNGKFEWVVNSECRRVGVSGTTTIGHSALGAAIGMISRWYGIGAAGVYPEELSREFMLEFEGPVTFKRKAEV